MFHLLVSFEGWPDGAGSISTDRIYIKPDEAPGNVFLSNGKLNIDKISKVPALLVNETGGRGPQFARIAYITSLAQGSRDTSIQYAVDSSIAPISNEDIEAYSNHLGIGNLKLTHTHWQVCNADIFKIFLLSRQNRAIGPKVFSAESINKQEPDLVSVMMPFGAEFKPVLTALQSATSGLGLRCVRADDIWEHHAIVQDIVNLIAKARVVVCDCSGKNANVFYEIGIAHSLGKEVLLIAQSESDIPFDLRHLRHIRYLPNKEGLDALSAAVQSRLRTVIARAI
ncbi:MAG: hypothetical protein AAB433_17290 [Nitrospirota bacterium]